MHERDPIVPPRDTSWGLVALLWGMGIGAAMQFAKFSVAFDDLTHAYAANPSLIGLAFSIVGFVGLVCGGSAGVLAERIGYRRLLIWASGFGALLSFGQSFLPPIEILLLMRLLEGISHIAIVVAAPVLMVRVAAKRHRLFIMTLWGSFFGVAFTIVGGLGPSGLKAYGVSRFFQAHALTMILMAILARGVLGSQRENSNDRTYSFRKFFNDSLNVYVNPRTVLPGLIFVFHTSMFLALLTFMPRLIEDSAVSALLFAILPITSTVTTVLVGFVPGGRVAPPVLALLAYVLVALLTLLAAGLTGSAQSFAVVAVFLFAVSGLIQGATYATIPYLNQALPDQARANGALAQLGNLGATLGMPLFAATISAKGAFGLAALVFFLCAAGAASAFLARRLKGREKSPDPAV